MQRVFICERKSTCPLFDHTWDWLVDARPGDISSLVFLFFQFARSVDEVEKKGSADKGNGRIVTDTSLTGCREALRVVFEPPVPRRSSRRLKERIMRYANNINTLGAGRRGVRGRSSHRQRSVAMVTAANEQVRVAVFCDAGFNVELSRQITEQILESFATKYASVLKRLEGDFSEEAKDQNEARYRIKYMTYFNDFGPPLTKLVEKHPKSTIFSDKTNSSETVGSFAGSRVDDDEKSARGCVVPNPSQEATRNTSTPRMALKIEGEATTPEATD